MVVPAAIRERAAFGPGIELEVTADDFGIRLERVAPPPTRTSPTWRESQAPGQ